MSEIATWIEKKNLTLEEVQKLEEKNKDDMILVNVNRLYSKYSEVIRKNLLAEYQVLLNVIANIYDEKEMYTSMKAKDVVLCFRPQATQYPENTFLRKDD